MSTLRSGPSERHHDHAVPHRDEPDDVARVAGRRCSVLPHADAATAAVERALRRARLGALRCHLRAAVVSGHARRAASDRRASCRHHGGRGRAAAVDRARRRQRREASTAARRSGRRGHRERAPGRSRRRVTVGPRLCLTPRLRRSRPARGHRTPAATRMGSSAPPPLADDPSDARSCSWDRTSAISIRRRRARSWQRYTLRSRQAIA